MMCVCVHVRTQATYMKLRVILTIHLHACICTVGVLASVYMYARKCTYNKHTNVHSDSTGTWFPSTVHARQNLLSDLT